jgi:uncharacterized repeat protein (TIGR02543 family)
MAKIKNRILIVLALVMLCAVGVFALAACNNTETYTVTFMVRENGATGDWQQYTTVDTNDDGSVTLPAEPTVDGYTFRDWYTDEACSADNVFDESNVTGDITVYALMAEANVTLNVTDGSGTSTQIAGTLSALSETTTEQEAAAAEDNLTFDGWYTDAAFTQKYSDGMDATALYGRYMAQITYDNGYETLHTELVTPGTLTSAPDARVDDFVKRYMDDEDISYNDSKGNAIDFTADTFDENEVVTVLWKTPGLEYEAIEGTDNYYVSGIDTTDVTYPAVSVLSKNVTIEGKAGCNVVAVDAAVGLDRYDQAEVFIFNEGIESIRGFYSASLAGSSAMKEVQLPTTLKVLENSFNMLSNNLSELVLPQGLEVIIDCFWSDMLAATGTYRENGLDIAVTIPSTVTNMVAVPKNLDLSKNENFEYDEDGRLYYVDGDSKILCSEYQSNVTEDSRLVVEEGVTGVQVYLLSKLNYDYLDLPSTFCEVGYNNAAEDYSAYTGTLLTPQSIINNPDATPASGTTPDSYAIVSNLDEITYVTIARTGDLPVSDYAFVSTSGVPHNGSEFEDDVKVVLIGDIAVGAAVEIRLTVSYSRDNEVTTTVLNSYKSGDTLTVAAILEAAKVSGEDYTVIVRNVGEVYEGGTITSDMYITVECYAKAGGFTYTPNADGKTATVTGFNSATAEQLTDGTYRVTIDMIDGYIVTAIADGAFKDVSGVSEVYISNAVTTIGAEAFMNMGNLRLVDIAPGGLSVIGESAFENAGCVQDSDGNWAVNTEGGVDELTMILPLADLTDIQPYAFKTKAIEKFTAVDSEATRNIQMMLMQGTPSFTEGMFLFAMTGSGTNRAIIKYTGINETKSMQNSSGTDTEITVRGAQLVAIAGGADYSNPSSGLALGFSYRYFDSQMGAYAPALATNVFEYEIMEGSVYYGGSTLQIYIGMVSKVHKNAFTDIEDEAPSINYYNCSYDQHMTIEQVQTQTSEIFEEGWFEGRDNSENTFMADAKAQSSRYPLM